ncbi:hypothetical protein M758_1G087800 [Ceratodon purpureus]|nr:hypothetical protein M758_1G087800 [Ceratodon purpureus]
MISQWATKRVCKFAMKHLLGRILRSELDLEQLDVQIGSGTIHLKELALNTTYFNDQLGDTSPVVLKEGLVGSVTAKNLWNILSRDQPCEVQIHGLELVLGPRLRPVRTDVDKEGRASGAVSEGNDGDGFGGIGGGEAAYMDIESGVRAIAQIVEKVLLGLCVKVTNLTIKYEHQQQQQEVSMVQEPQKLALDTKSPSTLVIRAGYVEYGNESSQSQDRVTDPHMVVKNVKFRGFTVGFMPTSGNSESKERISTRYMIEHMVPVLGGADGGGILGSIQLRIPLREGSLDIPKINTEFLVQPFKIYASVWRIEQVLALVHSISSSKRAMEETGLAFEKRGERRERLGGLLSTRSVSGAEGSVAGSSVFLPATNLISDWMRWGGADSQKIPGEMAEADLAASVDEFFECLDTGSMLLATDAWKQVEYSVKARFVSVSVEVAYADSIKGIDNTSKDAVNEQLHLNLAGTILSFAMSEKKTDLSLTVESVELWEVAQEESKEENAASPFLNEEDGTRRAVSSLIEETLPPYDVSLYPAMKVTNSLKGTKESNRLLRVISSATNQSVQVGLKCFRNNTDVEGSWSLDINTNFQPIIVWLDLQSVQRITHFLKQISTSDHGQENSSNQSNSTVAGSTSVHVTSSFSSVRIISGIPLLQPVCGNEDIKAFCVFDFDSASMDLQFMGAVTGHGDSLIFSVEDATVFLVSKGVDPEYEKLQASEVLKIKHQGEVDASVEVVWNREVETGLWIAKQAWDVAVAQKRRGDGGGGIGGGNFEFVAAISAEAAEAADLQLREKLIKSSSVVVQVRLPFVGVHISRSQYILFIELCSSFTNKDCASEENMGGSSLFSTPSSTLAAEGLQVSQTAVVVHCDRLDTILDLGLLAEETIDEVKHWDILHFDIHKLQVLSVLQMGGSVDASYLRIRHEECQVSGSPPDRWLSPLQGDTDEVLLFACSNNALQRGNGGGGNVLAVGSSGITVTYVSWPGRERLADDFIIANVKGCTIVAYGGRLDWANAVAAFFDPSEALKNKDAEQAQSSPISKDQLRKFFLLDLHDAALGYEPGLEALSAPEASAVACVLAAAAVRISSGDSVHFDQEQYDVRLRDVALHVLDLEFKKQAQFTYSTDSMQHTGFVQVAKETSMGVIVKIGGEGTQKWEVECGNNEICFDTCHDTTAACERLVAQLQQLFAPPLQQQSVQIKMHKVEVKAADVGEPPDLLDGVLENAFISLRDLQSEALDLESSDLSSKDVQEFIEDYVSEHTPGGLSEHSDDSISTVNGPFKSLTRGGASAGGWYEGDGPNIVEDHVPSEKPAVKLGLPKRYPKSVGRMVLQNMSVKWRLHEGSDWPYGDEDLGWNTQAPAGDSSRKSSVCLEVFLNGVNMQYDVFPTTELYASKLTVTVANFGVLDCSPNAPWKTVVGYHHVASRPRETSSQAVKIDMDAVRPDPSDVLEEYRVSFALLPIRLHLDQRHLDFCMKFFSSQFSASQGTLSEENLNSSGNSSLSSTPSVSSNLTDSPTEPLLPFFQMFEVLPFNIRVDYLPRRVDLAALRAGNFAELVNMVQWKGIELQLKHVKATGVHGLGSFSRIFLNEWLQDIFQNQLFKFVQGAGPIRPLYAVGSGAAKLVVSPAQHYWKQHHLLHEMRKSFKRVSSMYKREKRDPKQT